MCVIGKGFWNLVQVEFQVGFVGVDFNENRVGVFQIRERGFGFFVDFERDNIYGLYIVYRIRRSENLERWYQGLEEGFVDFS